MNDGNQTSGACAITNAFVYAIMHQVQVRDHFAIGVTSLIVHGIQMEMAEDASVIL